MTHIVKLKSSPDKIHYRESEIRKFTGNSHIDYFGTESESASILWTVMLSQDGEYIRMTIEVDSITFTCDWEAYDELQYDSNRITPPEPKKPTYGRFTVKSGQAGWVINEHPTVSAAFDDAGRLVFKPLVLEVDFDKKEFVIEEWGKKYEPRLPFRMITTLDPAADYKRSDDISC